MPLDLFSARNLDHGTELHTRRAWLAQSIDLDEVFASVV